MLSELHSLNLKLCRKQNKIFFLLHLIVAPEIRGGWGHNYSTKRRQAGRANQPSMYSLMSIASANKSGSCGHKKGLLSRQAGSVDVLALTANIFASATNRTNNRTESLCH
jgi:hypothetical protein